MKPPAISVVMPVYNREQFFPEAAASILAQSFRDFELIIVDDGSTDGTARLIDQAAAADPRVVVVRQKNLGIVAARNRGIERACGRYVAVMDSDDIAHPDRLLLSFRVLEEHDDTVCVGSGVASIDRNGARLRGAWVPPEVVTSDFSTMPPRLAHMSHVSATIRTSVLKKLGGYRSFFSLAEDLDLYLRLEEQGTIRCIQDCLIQVRQHRGRLSAQQTHAQEKLAIFAMLSAIVRRAGFEDPIGRVPDGEISYFTFKRAGCGVADVNSYAELAELRLVAALHRLGMPMGIGEWLRLALRYRLNARNRHPNIARRMASELAKFSLAWGVRRRIAPVLMPCGTAAAPLSPEIRLVG